MSRADAGGAWEVAGNFLTRVATVHGRVVLFLITLLTGILGYFASQNSFDYDLRDLMGENPEAYERYAECITLFGPDDDLVITMPMQGISVEALRQSLAVKVAVRDLPGVARCIDLSGAVQVENEEDFRRLLERPRRLERCLEELKAGEFFKGFLVSPDERAWALILRTTDLGAREKQDLVRRLRQKLEELFPQGGFHLLGYPVFTERYVSLMGRENAFFLGMSLFVAFCTGLALFGSLRLASIVTLTVALPGVWTQGCYALLGYRVSLFSALLMPVVMLVGLSMAVQFLSRFQRLVRFAGDDAGRLVALQRTLREALKPSLLCAGTTVIGFSSQIWSSVRGIRAFGVTASLGCGFSWACVFLLLPFLLQAWYAKQNRPVSFFGERLLNRSLARLAFIPNAVLLGLMVVGVVIVLGIPQLVTGSDPLSALPEHDPVVQAHRFYEAHFGGGTRHISLMIQAPGKRFNQFEALQMLRAVSARIASESEVLAVHSPSGLVGALEKELSAGGRLFPKTDEDVERILKLAQNVVLGILSGFLNPPFFDRAHLVVALRVSDSVRVAAVAQRLEAICRDEGRGMLEATATGRMLLSALVENQAIALQKTSFGTSLWIILALIGLGFQSFRAFGVALLANAVPIALSLGIMGWLGIPVDSATAMAPCICIGIIVDDTIHLIHESFVEERRGRSSERLRVSILRKLGWAVVSASLILLGGLGILCLSSFGPLRRFGALAVCTVIIGLVWELVLTPALLAATSPVRPTRLTQD